MTRFMIVPQWQGSPSARAMQLVEGAEAIEGELPRAACIRIDVPLEAGDSLDTGIRRYSVLTQVRDALTLALRGVDERALTVGGDCSVAIPAIAKSAARYGRIALIWADAHPDLHTAESSPSHAFGGMALRAALGYGAPGLTLPTATVAASDVILVGTRAYDDAEAEYAAAAGIRVLSAEALADPSALPAMVRELGVDAVHVHVDVDVLDPAEMPGVGTAEPFGVSLAALVATLKAVREVVPLAGASLTGFAPSSAAEASTDAGTLLRLIGALA